MICSLISRARRTHWVAVAAAILRILIAFAFVPAGLKKLLGQPFTDAHNTGAFHDFLHAFRATGWFYNFVGVLQLVIAALLVSQRFALAGAALAVPVLTAIVTFCWSTQVYPTATVATLIWLGAIALVAWDYQAWRDRATEVPQVDLALWRSAGIAVVGMYLIACAAAGEVYRPRGAKPDDPGFYLFPAILLVPVVTLVVEQRRRRRSRSDRS
ncbi:MAG: hypothetical protein WKG01_37455 [Kofleriaceae bacterium]